MSIYPTREIVDDYLYKVLPDGTCTRQCGAARDDVCRCRCGGEFHNLLRDWWSSPEARTGEKWCNSCHRAHWGTLAVGQFVLNCALTTGSGG